MSKCVYCLKTDTDTTFRKREHVISQFLGGFNPINPNLKGDLFCDTCNSKFSKLEGNFKEDSYEGIFAQMLNLENSGSVRIKGRNVDIKTVSGFGDKFFDEIFPFLKYEDSNFVVDFKPQLKVNNYADGYQVFTYRSLQEIKRGSHAKFNKVKKRLQMKPKTDMAVFAGSKDCTTAEIDKFIELLKHFGITYNEKERKYTSFEDMEGKIFEVGIKSKINADLMRFIAKIAFNYYIYCTQQEGKFYTDLLYGKQFNQIRNFVHKGIGNWGDIVKFSDSNVMLNIEGDGQKRVVAHTVLFTRKGNTIKAKVSLFGKSIYEVIIGEYPLKFDNQNFGCGHTFEPYTRTIHPISPRRYSLPRKVNCSFGIFKI